MRLHSISIHHAYANELSDKQLRRQVKAFLEFHDCGGAYVEFACGCIYIRAKRAVAVPSVNLEQRWVN